MALVPMVTQFRVLDLQKNEPYKNMLMELQLPLGVNYVPVVVEVWHLHGLREERFNSKS